jgi:hypothetical protein
VGVHGQIFDKDGSGRRREQALSQIGGPRKALHALRTDLKAHDNQLKTRDLYDFMTRRNFGRLIAGSAAEFAGHADPQIRLH